MAFDLAEVYHTKSMVNLLKKQGHNHLAMSLAEKILEKKPEYQEVADMYQAMRDEMKNSWQKMNQAKRLEKSEEPKVENKKVVLLQSLLERIQENKANRAG